ncbi:transporter associated domain-containing protein [Enterovirga sp.]|uniref:HlyC/CorC family transporter n=1 Tax=Enterovirga sp. TaxID=2026350 RepID=UPI002635E2E8|nr:transporter associated domain-containing protein [Enterovirga sp.]MDB5591640.1 hypothetical protein [Enterovirga sp.]
MSDWLDAPWPEVALALALLALAALLSALRICLARASRKGSMLRAAAAGLSGTYVREELPIRARVLGAMLVGNIVLNVLGTVWLTGSLIDWAGPAGSLYAVAVASACMILFEALARLGDRAGWTEAALRRVGVRPDAYAGILSATEEIREQVDLLHQQGEVVKSERDMLGGLLDLRELTVSDVMVHRTKMRTIEADLPSDEIVRDVLASSHTRLPVWRGTPDNIVGVLHSRDLLRASDAGRVPVDVLSVASAPWFVPDTTSLRDQLSAFLLRRQHVALVVDEYGVLMGLLTLEDILEEIVGDISDEHDVATRGVRPQPDGSILVDGSVPIRDLNRLMDWSLPDEEATTVAGLVIHEAQAIPEAGQLFTFHGYRFEVLRRVRNRLTALRVAPHSPVGPAAPTDRPRP